MRGKSGRAEGGHGRGEGGLRAAHQQLLGAGRQADVGDTPDLAQIGQQAADVEAQTAVAVEQERRDEQAAHAPAHRRADRRAGHTERRQRPTAVNGRVGHNDVHDVHDQHDQHRRAGVARSAQCCVADEQPGGEGKRQGHDAQIAGTIFDHFRRRLERAHGRPAQAQAERQGQHAEQNAQKIALMGDDVRLFGLARADVPGDQGSHAGRCGGEKRGDQHDRLVGEPDRGHCRRAEMADHEGIGQANRHVERLFADCRQRQGENPVGAGATEARP